MKRLTYMYGEKWRLRIGDTEYSGKAVDRLAAYEGTGLEPEEIYAAKNREHRGVWLMDEEHSGELYCSECFHTICKDDYYMGILPPYCEMCGTRLDGDAPIRCENCKHAYHLHEGESLEICGYLCGLTGQEMRAEDFCSRGERIDKNE